MSLKEYLKRYESNQKKPRKATKKVRKEVTSRIKIIEEDYVLRPTLAKKSDSEEEFSDDDKPLLTFQNNRTDELRLIGKFSLSRWTEATSVSGTSSEVTATQPERRRRRHDSPVSEAGEEQASSGNLSPTSASILDNASSTQGTPKALPSRGDDGHHPVESPPDHSVYHDSNGSDSERATARKDSGSELGNDIESEKGSVSAKGRPRVEKKREPADLSPPRRRPARRRHDSEESDLCPPRKGRTAPQTYAAVPPPRSRSPSVGRSSVHSRSSRRSESRPTREGHSRAARDESVETKYSSSKSDRDAKPIVRKKMTGKKETEEEKALREELEKRFALWSKGVKQVKEREAKLQEMAKEIEKPLARYAGDEDLEAHLKSQLYEDDPMYEYIMRKRRRENPGPPQCSKARLALPNRFSIPPGARWDGVDRSNGFETRLLSQKNIRQAEREEYYKWAAGTYE